MYAHAVEIVGHVREIHKDSNSPVVVIQAACGHPFPTRLAFLVIKPVVRSKIDRPITMDGEELSINEFIAKIRKTPIQQCSAEVNGTVSLVGAKQPLYHNQPAHERPVTTVSRVAVDSLVITKQATMPANIE